MLQAAQTALENAARSAQRFSGCPVHLQQTQQLPDGRCAGRFTLENGLSLILVPDPKASVFAYQTWFRVGSRDEAPNRTGMAHLFEHLMFKGTKTYKTGTFDREMERRGAQTNAATWVDWTYYTQALADHGDNLQTVINFESDRMQHLVLDEKTFRSELEVVKNERRMAVDDSLSGTLSEALMALAFKVHPYRWPTIGSMDHLEAANRADLEQFYRAFYAPNNATVVIVGALEPEQTLTQLLQAYGKIAPQKVLRPMRATEPIQTQAREQILRRPLLAPQLVLGFHAPAQNKPEFAALEMICDALVAGDTSRLHNRLVTVEQVATEISGHVLPFADPGLFELHVMAHPDADPHQIIRIIHEELAHLPQGLSEIEYDKACNGLELGVYESFKDVEGCAESIGHYATTDDDFTQAFVAAERYNAVKQEMLMQVATDVLRPTNCSAVIALPEQDPEANS